MVVEEVRRDGPPWRLPTLLLNIPFPFVTSFPSHTQYSQLQKKNEVRTFCCEWRRIRRRGVYFFAADDDEAAAFFPFEPEDFFEEVEDRFFFEVILSIRS